MEDVISIGAVFKTDMVKTDGNQRYKLNWFKWQMLNNTDKLTNGSGYMS